MTFWHNGKGELGTHKVLRDRKDVVCDDAVENDCFPVSGDDDVPGFDYMRTGYSLDGPALPRTTSR